MKKNGFTLVEILIAISLIGVVAALTLPNVQRSAEKESISFNILFFIIN